MKRKLFFSQCALWAVATASAQSLYYLDQESPQADLKWTLGSSLIYDDNTIPGNATQHASLAWNPSASCEFVMQPPQDQLSLVATLGVLYYFDTPPGGNTVSPQTRISGNYSHQFDERLRFVSSSYAAWEVLPDYSQGIASSVVSGPTSTLSTNNSVGYRWSERIGTTTGFTLSSIVSPDINNADRLTLLFSNQFRYQYSEQTIATLSQRYSTTRASDLSSNYKDIYFTGGVERRISANTLAILDTGAQFHSVVDGTDSVSPYMMATLNTRMNEQLDGSCFIRYGIEGYNTIQSVAGSDVVEFDNVQTLRLGGVANYSFSPKLKAFVGFNFVPTSYDGARIVTGTPSLSSRSSNLFNSNIGMSMKLNDYLNATASYDFTTSDSDISGQTYDRNRISIGMNSEF